MTRRQIHRGAAAHDDRLFAPPELPRLRTAASDLCWLLDRGYALRSSIDLVGNRYDLAARQRMALSRSVCSAEDAERRALLRVQPGALDGEELWVDGYNVLTILENALGGGVVLPGRDGCVRDIAGVHRRYRRVEETIPALRLVGETVSAWRVTRCRWFLDKPISNSGRLKRQILDIAAAAGWEMNVELEYSPDYVLARTDRVIATSDGGILDRCKRWVNLSREIILARLPGAWIVDLMADPKAQR